MKKNWQKPTITIFDDTAVLTGGNLNVAYETVKFCGAAGVETAVGNGNLTTTGGVVIMFRTVNDANAMGRWGGLGAATTAGVSGC